MVSTMAFGTAGCDDDDGFGALIRIFFNLAGSGRYASITVSFDPADVDAVLDPDSCNASAALAAAGCQIQVFGVETSTTLDGEGVRANGSSSGLIDIVISGCNFDALQNLGDCLFSGDDSSIPASVTAQGVCAPATACDTNPIICLSREGPNDFACAGITTTTNQASTTTSVTNSSTTTTIPSTTSSTTTTTTLPETTTTLGNVTCQITFGVTNADSYGALSYDVDYSGAPGGFDGSGGSVSCTNLAGDFAAFNDCDTPGGCPPLNFKELSTAIISAGGFATPANTSRCNFTGSAVPVAGDFGITVTDATRPDFTPTTATVVVNDITCTTPETTTTSVTSTSTTSVTSSTSVTTSSTTTTTGGGGGGDFAIQFILGDSGGPVGALQFSVNYSAAPGGFIGSGADIASGGTLQCTRSAGDFGSFNDNDAGLVNAAFVSLGGFSSTGSLQVAICNFASTGAAPVAGDFTIVVSDASRPDLTPISPPPAVTIGTILPLP
jgi:hypothetical protein